MFTFTVHHGRSHQNPQNLHHLLRRRPYLPAGKSRIRWGFAYGSSTSQVRRVAGPLCARMLTAPALLVSS